VTKTKATRVYNMHFVILVLCSVALKSTHVYYKKGGINVAITVAECHST